MPADVTASLTSWRQSSCCRSELRGPDRHRPWRDPANGLGLIEWRASSSPLVALRCERRKSGMVQHLPTGSLKPLWWGGMISVREGSRASCGMDVVGVECFRCGDHGEVRSSPGSTVCRSPRRRSAHGLSRPAVVRQQRCDPRRDYCDQLETLDQVQRYEGCSKDSSSISSIYPRPA